MLKRIAIWLFKYLFSKTVSPLTGKVEMKFLMSTFGHKFEVSMTDAPTERKMTRCKPPASYAFVEAAMLLLCMALILAIGTPRDCSFSMLKSATFCLS